MQIFSDFGSYLKAVFIDGVVPIVLLFFDFLGLLLFCYPGLTDRFVDESFARTVGGGIFLVSFLIANFLVYRKMAAQLSYKADIYFDVENTDFSPSYPIPESPFPGVQRNPHGFNKQGLPDWADLWAQIRVRNKGHEAGGWEIELDKTKTKIPPLFDRQNINIEPDHSIHDIPPRSNDRTVDFHIYILFTEQDPQAFAQSVKALVQSKKRYKFVIRYCTVTVDGKSKPRKLTIEGDFQGFHDKVFEHWRDYGFPELAELASFPES